MTAMSMSSMPGSSMSSMAAMSMSSMPASSMSGMAASMSSMAAPSMSSMPAASMSMPMSMLMTFTNSHSTPLYSTGWTPHSGGAYAGTCIFLIILAIIFRLITAYRHVLERKWHQRALNRRYIVVAGESEEEREKQLGLGNRGGSKTTEGTLTVRGVNEKVRVLSSPGNYSSQPQPWRLSTDLPRACLYFVQAGVGYLLMLAVMTMNVGYFMSVLAGLFLGELGFGRFTPLDDGSHH